MQKFLLKIYDFFNKERNKVWLTIIPIFIAVISIFLIKRIEPDTDIAKFLPYDQSSNSKVIYSYLRGEDRVAILFKGGDIEYLTSAADSFVDSFEQSDIKGVKESQFKIDPSEFLIKVDFILENYPYFLQDKDYYMLDSLLENNLIDKCIKEDKEQLLSPISDGITDLIAKDPLHFSKNVLSSLSQVTNSIGFNLIGDYLFTKDSSVLIMNFKTEYGASETLNNGKLLNSIDSLIAFVKNDYPSLEVSTIGPAQIAIGNQKQIKKDSIKSILVAIVIIIMLLWWHFKKIRVIIFISLPVVFGIIVSLSYMGLFNVNISAIALIACAVVFGIGVDYALMYLSRLKYTLDPREALSDVASPMIIGNITTVGAFATLLVMSSEGMRDFGLFSAIALIGAIIFALIFLPHLSKGILPKVVDNNIVERRNIFHKLTSFRFENIKYIFLIITLLTIVFYIFGKRVKFSGDFNDINYMTQQQRDDLKLISLNSSDTLSNLYIVSYSSDKEKLLENNETAKTIAKSLDSTHYIQGYTFITDFLPSKIKQQLAIERWNKWKEANRDKILNELSLAAKKYGFSPDAFEDFKTILAKDFKVEGREYFSDLLKGGLDSYIFSLDSTHYILNTLQVKLDGRDYIYQIFNNCGEKGDNSSFVFDSISMTNQMIEQLEEDFNLLLIICSILVFLFLWLAFRRIEYALIAFIPMVISWIWIIGIMGAFNINFNIVSIILATFIFGLGDDYTIFIVEGLQEEYKTKKELLSSYKAGVMLSSITMFVGVGSMSLASHPALYSLGIVTVIGMLCVVIMAFTLPPILFRWLTTISYKGERVQRVAPVRLSDICITIYCLIIFVLSSILFRLKTLFHSNQVRYHKELNRIMRYFSNHLPRVKVNILSPDGIKNQGIDNSVEKFFETPSIIICNHQSHIDLIYVMGLSEKIVIVTNKWVYHSPIYSDIVRRAQFISMEEGYEQLSDQIAGAVAKGYSVIIFPEGTRSRDCSIQPFKSGAFYLAEQLKLDIQPIFITGAGKVFPKGEFLLRRGCVNIRFMPRIKSFELEKYGSRPLKIAQSFFKYYKELNGEKL